MPLRIWVTEIRALEASTGKMKLWGGENVVAPSFELAQKWCDENKGYLKVVGELVAEIPCKKDTFEPDFKNKVDYEQISNN